MEMVPTVSSGRSLAHNPLVKWYRISRSTRERGGEGDRDNESEIHTAIDQIQSRMLVRSYYTSVGI